MTASPFRLNAWCWLAVPWWLCVHCSNDERPAPRDGAARAASLATAVEAATRPLRQGSVRDAPWEEVRSWLRKGEICWVVPTAGNIVFVTKCGGAEHRTSAPSLDELSRAVAEVDAAHDRIGFTTHYIDHREIPWAEAVALFPTGRVWEVEVNQNLRAFITTVGDEGTVGGRYVTVVGDSLALKRLAAERHGPLFVKLFFFEEIPWRRAVALIEAREIESAGSVHVNRGLLTTRSGKEYLTIPAPPGALEETIRRLDPSIPLTVE